MAVKLGRRWGLPVTHLDKLVWRPGWVMALREELAGDVAKVLRRKAWILDGALKRHNAQAIAAADLVLFLDYPAWLCLARVLRRIFSSYRQVRSDMADGCPEQWDWAFFVWIWRWPRTHRPDVLLALEKAKESRAFRSPRELEDWLCAQ